MCLKLTFFSKCSLLIPLFREDKSEHWEEMANNKDARMMMCSNLILKCVRTTERKESKNNIHLFKINNKGTRKMAKGDAFNHGCLYC